MRPRTLHRQATSRTCIYIGEDHSPDFLHNKHRTITQQQTHTSNTPTQKQRLPRNQSSTMLFVKQLLLAAGLASLASANPLSVSEECRVCPHLINECGAYVVHPTDQRDLQLTHFFCIARTAIAITFATGLRGNSGSQSAMASMARSRFASSA